MAKKETAKSRTIAVRIISMALTGYYKTLVRPRTHRPLSMLKYDPVGMSSPTPVCHLRKPSDTEDVEMGEVANGVFAVKKKVLFLEAKRGGSK
ncbi:hypothetical protein E4T38_04675 [Aureobasidium subglaciale]|nr:hypothetical protein E4T38_04675 [Aureobasidium subglaciale]KAI5223761.1 hypothetical protein E4T40_04451 [Aureobasidium subglaciale]KAI5227126.1 hypothetical protein E4T41_04422 [Aureobasidium subglaciale]KAI5262555.1 hypothetical protein E4T46_04308 [Aureobasidium subglaciale]